MSTPPRRTGRLPPDQRRRDILAAALAAFLERGYAETTIADIRRLSGASTGSIYHLFPAKGALALGLLKEAVTGWQAAGASAADEATAPEAAIRASVAGLVRWGLRQPALFRFLDELRSLSVTDADFAAVREFLDQGQQAARRRYDAAVAAGACRPLPWPLAHALMLGPAYDLLRSAAGGAEIPADAAERLAEAAWQTVRASTTAPASP